MLALAIIFSSTFLLEVANSIGKHSVNKKIISVYSFAFLGVFWCMVFLILSIFLGAEVKFSPNSIPTLLIRIILECLVTYISAQAIIKSDRSTNGFLGALSIPLLLVVDSQLGYSFSPTQYLGLTLVLCSVALLFIKGGSSKKGVSWTLAAIIVGVATASLYKYNITHFNSVVVEQVIVLGSMLVFFSLMTYLKDGKLPFVYLLKRQQGTQSLSFGLSVAIESFAFIYAPATIIIAIKRGLSIIWAIVFGKRLFNEQNLGVKIIACSVCISGLALLAI